ncbi:MAG: hypothetical protein HC780_00525 [Leptolyngbyaceae cyanobacterium CSU_1_3]|nr:hypothetical protein [Leptolyngbyaceae cyanobacterium CSU_1_3]
MEEEQKPPETWNVSGGETEKNSFDGNNAPIIKDNSGSIINNTTNTINNYNCANPNASPDSNLGEVKELDINANPSYENKFDDSESIQIGKKLNDLLTQKRDLEIKLKRVESEINRIQSALKSEVDPGLAPLLHWLSGRKHLSRKYGNIALRSFQSLKQEAEAKGNIDDFYFQIESYLELIYFSLSRNKKLFLREPGVPPTYADFNLYDHASKSLYEEAFRILKENIPQDNVEPSLKVKVEHHFDELLKRLQAYF